MQLTKYVLAHSVYMYRSCPKAEQGLAAHSFATSFFRTPHKLCNLINQKPEKVVCTQATVRGTTKRHREQQQRLELLP
eukprot:4944294-Amphidinium_carterae.3